MTIRNIDAFINGLWDWSILDGCFGSSHISPTDIDGTVERRGRLLYLEGKPSGKEVSKGQQIYFNQLLGINRLFHLQIFTIVIIWGIPPDKPEFVQVWGKEKIQTDLEAFRTIISKWYQWADKNPLNKKIQPSRGRVRE